MTGVKNDGWLDLLVAVCVVIELKAVENLIPLYEAQLRLLDSCLRRNDGWQE